MKVRNYSPLVFSNLLEFATARSMLDRNKERIGDLLNIIDKYDLHESIGVCLLHKHFNLLGDEILLRAATKNGFSVVVAPNTTKDAMPYVLAFSKENKDEENSLYPIEFISSGAGSYVDDLDRVTRNEKFLSDFRDALERHKLTEVFGLSLIPHFILARDASEELSETTNTQERVLQIVVVKSNQVNRKDSTQTLWVTKRSPSINVTCEPNTDLIGTIDGHTRQCCMGHCEGTH